MRNYQKSFFKDRHPSDLQASKLAEKTVDDHIKTILHDQPKNQTTLEL
jgi:hypothetical protein